MIRSLLPLLILLASSLTAMAQQAQHLLDSAETHYQKGKFEQALAFYDAYFDAKGSPSNYNTFHAAIAACHSGEPDKASAYLGMSARIGYDTSAFEKFAGNGLDSCLRQLPEWEGYISVFRHKTDSAKVVMSRIQRILSDSSLRVNHSPMADRQYWQAYSARHTTRQLIRHIKTFNNYPTPDSTGFWTLYSYKAHDTLTVPYMLFIPRNYDPARKSPLLVYLHGGVINRPKFANPTYVEGGLEMQAMRHAMNHGTFILYAFGRKDFAWLHHQKAFEAILGELAQVKSLYNIDDNRVYVGGHSNGGEGAFWFALNKPSAFASFFGLNYLPKQQGGNTHLRNLTNSSSFYGMRGIDDDVFPFDIVNGIYKYALGMGANWQNCSLVGDHTVTLEKIDSLSLLLDTVMAATRNTFPKKLQWETEDIRNGRNGWLEITQLDTLAERASWHEPWNPVLTVNGKSGTANFTIHKSGAVKAEANGNEVRIYTSRVKAVAVHVSPHMFNLRKKIKVYVNDQLVYNKKAKADKSLILAEFLHTRDREMLFSGRILLQVN